MAVLTRLKAGPEAIEAAKTALRLANTTAAIQRAVDEAPPLTDEQRSKLALLLSPAGAK